jgi:nucleoside-diphosphate-sugar epimerase
VSRTVFVSGATGFLGSAIANALEARGFEVRRGARRLPAASAAGTWTAYGEIGAQTRWEAAVDCCETVVHCAGLAHVPEGPAAAARARTINVEGTTSLARAAARAGVARFILISSAQVLGSRSDPGRSFTDGSAPRPENVYAAFKLAAELRLVEIARSSGLDSVILRPPMVHGPGARGNFARLVRLVASRLPLPLGGAIAPKRFIGVDNLASAVVQAVEAPRGLGGSFLVGDAEITSTRDLVHRIARGLGMPARTFAVPLDALRLGARVLGRERDVARLLDPFELDTGRFCALFGWQPPLSLERGLEAALRSRATPPKAQH